VQGSNQGNLLLARVRKGLGTSLAMLPIPSRRSAHESAQRLRTACRHQKKTRPCRTWRSVSARPSEGDREALFVVGLTTNGVKEWVLYTSTPRLQKVACRTSHRLSALTSCRMVIEQDKAWAVYRQFAGAG